MKKPVKLVLAALVIVVIIIIVWLANKKNPNAMPATNTTAQGGLGAQVFGKVGKDPIGGNIPETNPFNTGVNPYSSAYKNPFSQ